MVFGCTVAMECGLLAIETFALRNGVNRHCEGLVVQLNVLGVGQLI